MPRFFFDYRNSDGQLERDGEGIEFPSKTKETPRLCRGGSSSLTFQGVHRRNSDS
jgi:hypothetical protein